MPSPCKRCAATRLINLDTAHRIGVVSGCLVGGAIGAFRAAAANQTLSLATARFPLATIGAVAGGQSGVRLTSSLFAQWLPPGTGTPWLCLACGHTFRQSYPPLAAAH
ncbi:hypothetical protein [Halomonas sp.]|uniref:hypothetical protein n=1 Tax=Halomonas sp. TaxID=1486246 RepID=UPI003A8EDE2C